MSDVYAKAKEFRARLLAGEREAALELLQIYALAAGRVERRVAEITSELEGASVERAAALLDESSRLAVLSRDVALEVNRFSTVASFRVVRAQREAINAARLDAAALVGEANGSPVAVALGRLNPRAVEAAAGLTSDASPVRSLFAKQGERVAAGVARELSAGVAEGADVRTIAGRVRDVLGGELTRSLTVARTETLRAYRAAALDTFEGSGVVARYEWLCALDARACVVCLALDGSTFATRQPMPAHVNCRCAVVPVVTGRPRAPRLTGREFFARLDAGAQKQILGAGAFAAFRDGRLSLGDLVGFKLSPRWGLTAYRRPLGQILKTGE